MGKQGKTLLFWAIASFAISGAGGVATQEPKTEGASKDVVLQVEGDLANPLQLSLKDLSGFPRKTVKVKGNEGDELVYEGVAVVDLLQKAGFKFGQDLRGPALSNYLLVEAADAYKVVFSLPELDPAWTEKVVLLADTLNGKPMEAREGPLRLVVPDEKRHARWVRRVVALRVGKA